MTVAPRHLLTLVTIAVAVVALVSGAVGLSAASADAPRDWPKLLFETVGLLFLQSPELPAPPRPDNWSFAVARIAATLWVSLGVTGVWVRLYRPAGDALRRCGFWLARVALDRSPVIVIGLGCVNGPVVSSLRARRRPVFAVTADATAPGADEARRRGALVVGGDGVAAGVRRQVDLGHASDVFVATGSDTQNLRIVGELMRDADEGRVGAGGRPLRCHVHISSPVLAATLVARRLSGEGRRRLVVRSFNLHDEDARDCLLADGVGLLRRQHAGGLLHVVMLGFGVQGQSLALQLARLAHLSGGQRVRLTVLDAFGDNVNRFLARYPAFAPDPASFDLISHGALEDPLKDEWASRRWRPADRAWRSNEESAVEYVVNGEFVDIPALEEVPDAARQALLARLWAAERGRGRIHRAIVVCFDRESRNFEAVLWLRELLESERLERGGGPRVPIYAHLPTELGFQQVLSGSAEFRDSEAVTLVSYGGHGQSDPYDRIARPVLLRMAAAVHRRYSDLTATPVAFEDLAPGLQASNLDVAAHAVLKLDALAWRARPARPGEPAAALTVPADAVEQLARMEHHRWMAERLIAGWRYGETRVSAASPWHENRRRLSLVPWSLLAAEQRQEVEKDVSQVLALPELYAAVGLRLEPITPAPPV